MKFYNTHFLADGVLIVEKPIGLTSHDIINKIRRRFKPIKIGHAGTLDPFANGVLIIAFNKGTRLLELLGAGNKDYRAILVLGRSTTTGDYTGITTAEALIPKISFETVQNKLVSIIGEHQQIPPSYSAVKYQGSPLYSYARQGIKVFKSSRLVIIYDARLLNLGSSWIEFQVSCSRGTYVRVLGEKIAQEIGTIGYLVSLRRLRSRPFTEKEAVGLGEILTLAPTELEHKLITLHKALARCGLPSVHLDEDSVRRIRKGQLLSQQVIFNLKKLKLSSGTPFMVFSSEGFLVAVLRWIGQDQINLKINYKTIRVFLDSYLVRNGKNMFYLS